LAAISPLSFAGVGAGHQVFLDGQVGKTMPAFHHLHHATLHQVGRREVFDALAAQLDRALGHLAAFPLEQVGHGSQRGGLARAVATQDRDDATLRHLQRHAFEHEDHVVVDDLDAVDVENDIFRITHGGSSIQTK
jgi:hypothetical protein